MSSMMITSAVGSCDSVQIRFAVAARPWRECNCGGCESVAAVVLGAVVAGGCGSSSPTILIVAVRKGGSVHVRNNAGSANPFEPSTGVSEVWSGTWRKLLGVPPAAVHADGERQRGGGASPLRNLQEGAILACMHGTRPPPYTHSTQQGICTASPASLPHAPHLLSGPP